MAGGGGSSISTQWDLGEVGTLVIRACGRGWGACRAKRGVWVEKLENRAWNRELARAAYASPRRPRWLGGTLAAWLGLGDAGAAHRHGLGCDFGYDFSQMAKMCIGWGTHTTDAHRTSPWGEILGRASRPERPRGRTDHPDRAGPPDPCSTTRPRAWTGFPPSYYNRSPFETSPAT